MTLISRWNPTRWTTIGFVLATLLVISYVACSTYAIIRSFQYDQQIAGERRQNTTNACLRASDQNDAIIAYLRKLGGDANDIQRARVFFPHQSREACEKAARETVSGP